MKARPKIEIFAEDLPGRLAFTDIDAMTELNGHFLFIEFKSSNGEIRGGQCAAYMALTKLSPKITFLYLRGNPETMSIWAMLNIHRGIISEEVACDIAGVHAFIKDWVEWTKQA